jgi:integration host factor subunit beta
VELIFDNIVGALDCGEKVKLRDFGSFRTRQRGRIARNPRTGVRVEVPAKKIPYFTPSKDLKQKLFPKIHLTRIMKLLGARTAVAGPEKRADSDFARRWC